MSEVRAWGLHSKPAQVQSSVFPLADLNLIGLGLLDRLQTGLPCESLRDRGRRPVQQFSVRNNSCPGHLGAFLVVQVVNHLPAMQQTWVRSLGWEDLLEKAVATHSSILVWRIPWTEDPGELQSIGLQRVGHD